jgi:hypothetical protein
MLSQCVVQRNVVVVMLQNVVQRRSDAIAMQALQYSAVAQYSVV